MLENIEFAQWSMHSMLDETVTVNMSRVPNSSGAHVPLAGTSTNSPTRFFLAGFLPLGSCSMMMPCPGKPPSFLRLFADKAMKECHDETWKWERERGQQRTERHERNTMEGVRRRKKNTP